MTYKLNSQSGTEYIADTVKNNENLGMSTNLYIPNSSMNGNMVK